MSILKYFNISGIHVSQHQQVPPPQDRVKRSEVRKGHSHHRKTSATESSARRNFVRWRPRFHLMASHGWLNDPCGPGYDPKTGKYHVAYQWNPNGNDWGDITWGHATSADLVSWTRSSEPCLSPSEPYDDCGIFTGCFKGSNINGEEDGTLTYFYTSVNQLPIHYTLPYQRGCESLSIATSKDAGVTWNKQPCNPILAGPPTDLEVTGWRDPFVTKWSRLPESTFISPDDKNEPLCGFISGGIRNQTPTSFVYEINPDDFADWKYKGYLTDVGLNLCPSRWSGDFGLNWEVANMMTLSNEENTTSRDFFVVGTEGCLPSEYDASHRKRYGSLAKDGRTPRGQLWMSLKRRGSSTNDALYSSAGPLMEYAFSGILDHGLLYAANSFWDPVVKRQTSFGWIMEDDLPNNLRHRQNWSGVISLPRILQLTTMAKVKRSWSTTSLEEITSLEVTPDGKDTYTIRTLGISPHPNLNNLREGARKVDVPYMTDLPCERGMSTRAPSLPLTTSQWELDTEIIVRKRCKRVGIAIGHDPGTTPSFLSFTSYTFPISKINKEYRFHPSNPPILGRRQRDLYRRTSFIRLQLPTGNTRCTIFLPTSLIILIYFYPSLAIINKQQQCEGKFPNQLCP